MAKPSLFVRVKLFDQFGVRGQSPVGAGGFGAASAARRLGGLADGWQGVRPWKENPKYMYLRCGFLAIADSADSAEVEAMLDELPRLLSGVEDSFLPLTRRVYVEPHRYQVEETLRQWCDEEELDLILTVGGTLPAPGPSAREIVPEATVAVLERLMPSLPERMRSRAAESDSKALLDRGVAGIRGRTLIVNLPIGQGLTEAFLESILDVIPLVADRLAVDGEEAAPDAASIAPAPPVSQPDSGRLDKEEFAAFLRRGQEES